jgi:TPR repeat protein
MKNQLPFRIPPASVAPLVVLLGWLILLPLAAAAGWGWPDQPKPPPLEGARREFLVGAYSTALADYRKLAESGNVEAQYWVGHMVELGLGGKANAAEAASWYDQAATGGMVLAERRLGEIDRDGQSVAQDAAKARSWLERAATAGDAVAERELGLLWKDGIGGRKDPIEAYVWLALAARHGDQRAVKPRDQVLTEMSQADQTEAQSLAASRAARDRPAPVGALS